MEYGLQVGGSSSFPSLMALHSTKYDCQLRFFSVLNFFSSSFIFLSFFWLLLFCTTIVVSLGVFMLVLVLFHSLERFVFVLSCSTWRMCKNAWSFMILLWMGMVPEYGGSMDNQCWSAHTSVCSIVDLQDQNLWRTWCLEESVPSQ